MSFLELARKRSSVRKFKDIPVEKEKLEAVLEAARIAPSAVNYQPWHFIVAMEEFRKKVAGTYHNPFIQSAPVIIVACVDHNKAWRRADGKGHGDIDAAIAIDHLMLEAAEQGLGTCWVCGFDSMQCHKLLKLPASMEIIALIPVGYPSEDVSVDVQRHDRQRKKLEDIVSWDGYGE